MEGENEWPRFIERILYIVVFFLPIPPIVYNRKKSHFFLVLIINGFIIIER